jgi:hypothetical protein
LEGAIAETGTVQPTEVPQGEGGQAPASEKQDVAEQNASAENRVEPPPAPVESPS